LIEGLRGIYDYVIIDTPPLGSVIDSAIVAKISDGAIVVIEANSISYRFAQSVKEQLEKSNCRILGAVLNKVVMDGKGYYGRYYDGYYGKY
jgi:Mrp family chromosome partitioning ATPase